MDELISTIEVLSAVIAKLRGEKAELSAEVSRLKSAENEAKPKAK